MMRRWIAGLVVLGLIVGAAWWGLTRGQTPAEPVGPAGADRTAAKPAGLPEPVLEPNKVLRQPVEMDRPKGLALTLETYPRTDGSTSAEPLGVWTACRLLGKPCFWGGWAERRLCPRSESSAEKPVVDMTVYEGTRHHGTHDAYVRLIEGKVDLIYECRVPSEDERTLMKQKGIELDIRPVARDAFVFLRHNDNPVKTLRLQQVRDIYTLDEAAMPKGSKGKIVNWKTLGGEDAAINAYGRNLNSGSQETMMSLVMKDRKVLSGRAMTGMSMAGAFNNLHRDKHGIGYTFFYYERFMSPQPSGKVHAIEKRYQQAKPTLLESPVKMLAIDGVAPTRETIADGSYPLVTDVYVVTRKDLKADHPAARLRDWLLTDEGQRLVAETGYAPLPQSTTHPQKASR